MKKPSLIIFWLLVVNFLWLIAQMTVASELLRGPVFLVPFGLFFALGIILIIAALKETGKVKKFMLLAGVSAVGVFLSILLHNLIYGYFIYFYGKDFWERIGVGDEPVFFILAIIVFPILFLAGTTGAIISLIKKK